MSSEDDAFTLSTMVISDDENDYHELNQEEQIQQIAKQERQIREVKKRKQALRRKWVKMLSGLHRENVQKESERFEKHKQNLINQCIELTSKTFISKTIFNQTDVAIASKSVPSILPIRVLKHRPYFVVNATKKIDRTANNAAYTLDIKTPLLSLWPQALDTISPVFNLGISIPPLPNKLSDADNAAPGAALNALPTVPPYTPLQAVSPLLDFIPADFELRREQRPYTAAAKAAESLFAERNEKRNQKLKGKSNVKMQLPLFFHSNDLVFLKQTVAEEFEELRNLEFTYHENDDDNIDEYSSKSDDDEKIKYNPIIKEKEIKKTNDTIKKTKKPRKVKKGITEIQDRENKDALENEEVNIISEANSESEQESKSSYQNNEDEEDIKEKEASLNFTFDTTELQSIMDVKCLKFIDNIVFNEVVKRRINLNVLESSIITKPLLKFSNYFSNEVLPLYPSAAMENCKFSFLSNEMDNSVNKFLKKLLSPKDVNNINKKEKNVKSKDTRSKHKHHRHHHRIDGNLSKKIKDQSDNDEAINQAEA